VLHARWANTSHCLVTLRAPRVLQIQARHQQDQLILALVSATQGTKEIITLHVRHVMLDYTREYMVFIPA
jgi:hypothetical protein